VSFTKWHVTGRSRFVDYNIRGKKHILWYTVHRNLKTFRVTFKSHTKITCRIFFIFLGLFIAAFTLMNEMVRPNRRMWGATIAMCFLGVSLTLQSLLAYLVRDWRNFNLVITVPNALSAICYWLVYSTIFFVSIATSLSKLLNNFKQSHCTPLSWPSALSSLSQVWRQWFLTSWITSTIGESVSIIGWHGWCCGNTLASHRCGHNGSWVRSSARVLHVSWVCCWFSSLLRGFFSGFSGFPPSVKINIPKF
jgi:hypothetical protein